MSARDDAIKALYEVNAAGCPETYRGEECAACRHVAERLIDAIPPAVLAQLAIESGALVDDGTWIDPSEEMTPPHYEDEARPDDAITLYRLPTPGERTDR